MRFICNCKCEIEVEASNPDEAEDQAYDCIEEVTGECEVRDCICDCEESKQV